MSDEKHKKLVVSMRYWLQGRKYHKALKAMEFAKGFHTGMRKDGLTPEFDHQIRIGHFVRTLENSLMYPEDTLCVVFLHDVCEDYDIPFMEIEDKFGKRVADATRLLTKAHRGERVPDTVYYGRMHECPIASIDKGGDRIHNFQSMPGVFSTEKQIQYIEECQEHILPMLKKAKRMFPEQECAYENIKHMLESQIDLIRRIHEAEKMSNEETRLDADGSREYLQRITEEH